MNGQPARYKPDTRQLPLIAIYCHRRALSQLISDPGNADCVHVVMPLKLEGRGHTAIAHPEAEISTSIVKAIRAPRKGGVGYLSTIPCHKIPRAGSYPRRTFPSDPFSG
jgi:hypothetical protein